MKFFLNLIAGLSAFSLCVSAQTGQIKFMHLDRQSGLSGNSVYCIFQDSRNFIWFGTDAGLNRFDGFTFKVFKTIKNDSSSISSNNIRSIAEDDSNNLWIGTEFGLNKFDKETETFARFNSNPEDTGSISFDFTQVVRKHPSGDIYIGTGGRGLCRYNIGSGTISRINFINKTNESFFGIISDIVCLPDGRLCLLIDEHKLVIVSPETWIIDRVVTLPLEQWGGIKRMVYFNDKVYVGSSSALYMFHVKDFTLKQIPIPTEYGNIEGLISGVGVDQKGMIWIGSTNSGVFLLDPAKLEIIDHLNYNEFDPTSISGPDVSSIFIDNTGKAWVGTWGSGINYYHPEIVKFELFGNTQSNLNNLPSNKVNTFCVDNNKNVWIGTESGIAVYSISENGVRKNVAFGEMLGNLSIQVLFCDSRNNIWAGSYLKGLYKINPNTGAVTGIKLFNPNVSIRDIVEPEPDVLWVSTLGEGIIKYNTITGEFKYDYRDKISTFFLNVTAKDIENNVWIGTSFGLNRFNISDEKVEKYFYSPNGDGSIASNHIQCIQQSSDGHVFIGTSNGLNIYEKKTNSFITIKSEDGLRDDYICSIEEDNLKRVWVSTLKGLSCISIQSYQPFKYSIINYTGYDGIQTMGFRTQSSLKLNSGLMIFGGNKGINFFHPERISADNSLPIAIITGFQLNNRDIIINEEYNGRVIITKSITEAKKIVLKHDENTLTFNYAALNAIIPEKCTFKYKLEGFEEKWKKAPSDQRYISYTNLDPGEYVLKIKASNGDGVWNDEGVKLKISIEPPFWKTRWAIVFYILLILIALIVLRWLIIKKERLRTEEKLAIQEADQLHEMDLMKLKFFTNVSHEFRTPLTLIITPLEKILKELKYKDLEIPLQTVYRNSKRLLNLVNQLLDFRKMEVSGLKLTPTTGDIIDFLKEMVISFTDLAERKNISFKFRSNIKELIMQFDHDKMEKIIFNLLSNSFKYTLEKGEIVVEIDYIEQISFVEGAHISRRSNGKELQVKVRDTGIGIASDKLENIFERFIQADKTNKIIEHGSGIGLSLTREFVKLHGGEIWAESDEGKGSCFTFTIPLDKMVIKADQSGPAVSFDNKASLKDEEKIKTGLPSLLLVEDNEDLRFYLNDNLKQTYKIFEATNGKEGVSKAISEIPDLIISDIMMPELDGLELCKQLKKHPNTSHIPIILLTAKTSEEQKIAGFEGGADAYITKPFSFEILETQIKNLVNQRKQLKSLFNKKIEINPSEISVTSVDEKLIRKALEVVELNISNSDFSVEQLGRDLGMSRVHLYKKLLSLTGKSPLEFIRVLRLKRAAQLLQKSQLRVSEIAYEVGFNNPKYFSKYFKEEFGMLPSEYAATYNAGSKDKVTE